MANDANAKALEAKLQDVFGGYGLHALAVKGADLHLTIGDLAKKLAALGVLVPSALTDEQVIEATKYYYEHDSERVIRETLERIAKGEPG